MSVPPPPSPYTTSGYNHEPRRGTPWVFIIGAVTLLIALVCCGVGGFSAARTMQGIANAPVHQGSASVTLEQGEKQVVWVEDSPTAICSSADSGLDGSVPAAEKTVNWQGTDLYVVWEMEATQAGTYTVTCSQPFRVGDDMPIVASLGIMASGAVCCLGVVLGGIGLIIWLRRR